MKLRKRLLRVTLTLSTCAWIVLWTGCATKLVVIPADKQVVRMPAGQSYSPGTSGYFVPDARMQEILEQLEQQRLKPEVKPK